MRIYSSKLHICSAEPLCQDYVRNTERKLIRRYTNCAPDVMRVRPLRLPTLALPISRLRLHGRTFLTKLNLYYNIYISSSIRPTKSSTHTDFQSGRCVAACEAIWVECQPYWIGPSLEPWILIELTVSFVNQFILWKRSGESAVITNFEICIMSWKGMCRICLTLDWASASLDWDL